MLKNSIIYLIEKTLLNCLKNRENKKKLDAKNVFAQKFALVLALATATATATAIAPSIRAPANRRVAAGLSAAKKGKQTRLAAFSGYLSSLRDPGCCA